MIANPWLPPSDETPVLPVAYTAKETAKALSISERTLFTWTAQGIIRCIRVGGVKRYALDEIKDFLARSSNQSRIGPLSPSEATNHDQTPKRPLIYGCVKWTVPTTDA